MAFAFNTDEIIDLTTPEKQIDAAPGSVDNNLPNDEDTYTNLKINNIETSTAENTALTIREEDSGLVEIEVLYLAPRIHELESEASEQVVLSATSLEISDKEETSITTNSLTNRSFQTMCDLIGVQDNNLKPNESNIKNVQDQEEPKRRQNIARRGRKRKLRIRSALYQSMEWSDNKELSSNQQNRQTESESRVIAIPKQKTKSANNNKVNATSRRGRRRTTSVNRYTAELTNHHAEDRCVGHDTLPTGSSTSAFLCVDDVDVNDLLSNPPTAFYNQNRRYKCPHCDYVLSVNRKEKLHKCVIDNTA